MLLIGIKRNRTWFSSNNRLSETIGRSFYSWFKRSTINDKQSPGLILLRRVRDEAHRFAITFQRQKRNANLIKSPFEDIKGIGKKRLNNLLTSFDDVKTISHLTPEVINGETGIPLKIAKKIIVVAKQI